MKIRVGFVLAILYTPLFAASLGVIGEVFPVAEQSFLVFIQFRLKELEKTGQLDAITQHWQQQVEEHVHRPTPLLLPHAIHPRSFLYRPEVTIDSDIKDATNHVLIAKGTTINALSQLPHYNPCWLFLNAENATELRWAKQAIQTYHNPKIILTGGAIQDAEASLQTVIYFDQGGVITQKLGIQSTPARVTRRGNTLLIEELAL